MEKKLSRLRRASATRRHIQKLQVARLTIHRSNQHIYAQVLRTDGTVVAAANTLQKSVAAAVESTKDKAAAAAVGRKVAEAALAAGVLSVAFDRSGYKYHGRVAALADAAREAGLKF
jgi:large subunit ribosomal protein L18